MISKFLFLFLFLTSGQTLIEASTADIKKLLQHISNRYDLHQLLRYLSHPDTLFEADSKDKVLRLRIKSLEEELPNLLEDNEQRRQEEEIREFKKELASLRAIVQFIIKNIPAEHLIFAAFNPNAEFQNANLAYDRRFSFASKYNENYLDIRYGQYGQNYELYIPRLLTMAQKTYHDFFEENKSDAYIYTGTIRRQELKGLKDDIWRFTLLPRFVQDYNSLYSSELIPLFTKPADRGYRSLSFLRLLSQRIKPDLLVEYFTIGAEEFPADKFQVMSLENMAATVPANLDILEKLMKESCEKNRPPKESSKAVKIVVGGILAGVIIGGPAYYIYKKNN